MSDNPKQEAMWSVMSGANRIEALEAENAALRDALLRKGYRETCDIPACNCGSQWTHGGKAEARLGEIYDALGERTNGKTALQAIEELEAENARLKAEIERQSDHYASCIAPIVARAERAEKVVEAGRRVISLFGTKEGTWVKNMPQLTELSIALDAYAGERIGWTNPANIVAQELTRATVNAEDFGVDENGETKAGEGEK